MKYYSTFRKMWGYEKCVENDRLDKKRIVGLKGCILLIYSCGNCRLSTIPPLFYMTEGTENGKSDGKIVLKFDRKWKGRGGEWRSAINVYPLRFSRRNF